MPMKAKAWFPNPEPFYQLGKSIPVLTNVSKSGLIYINMSETDASIPETYVLWRTFVDNNAANPALMLVEALKSSGLDLSLREVIGKDNQPLPQYVEVFAPAEEMPKLESITSIPEVRALLASWKGFETNVAACNQWDLPTKLRVRSLSFQRSAERGFSYDPDRDQTIAQNLLKGLSPLTFSEMQTLMQEALAGELSA